MGFVRIANAISVEQLGNSVGVSGAYVVSGITKFNGGFGYLVQSGTLSKTQIPYGMITSCKGMVVRNISAVTGSGAKLYLCLSGGVTISKSIAMLSKGEHIELRPGLNSAGRRFWLLTSAKKKVAFEWAVWGT